MKNILLLLGISILLNACCTKKACLNAFDLNEITLYNFDTAAVDSILISAYEQGDGFTTLLTSDYTVTTAATNPDADFRIYSPIDLNANSDYKIEFLQIGLSYEITNIQTDRKKCNDCFLTTDKYTVLKSYELNGTTVDVHFFEITQ